MIQLSEDRIKEVATKLQVLHNQFAVVITQGIVSQRLEVEISLEVLKNWLKNIEEIGVALGTNKNRSNQVIPNSQNTPGPSGSV